VTLATVCIPTVPARRSLLTRALHSVTRFRGIEVLVADGLIPMGDKVNAMFAQAKGRYVIQLDDDDYLSADWLMMLAPHLRDGPDFIGHKILWLEDGKFAGLVDHCITGDPLWRTLNRGVSPKCPVLADIARNHTFGNAYTADRDWSQAVWSECESGSNVNAPLYVYDHWNAHMLGTEPDDYRSDRDQRDVGMWPYDDRNVRWLA
jgi:hypothetical protein